MEAEALSRLNKDLKVPGFKLVEGRTNRIFSDKEKAQKLLLELGFKLDDIAPRELVSPAGAETLLKKAHKSSEWGIISLLVTHPKGKLGIAPESDPRPALTRGAEFEQPEEE